MSPRLRWRMSASQWEAVFAQCLVQPDRSHLVRAAVSFDFRHVTGGLDVVTPLAAVVRDARRHPDFMARLARTATDWKVPLGRRGRVSTDRDGRTEWKPAPYEQRRDDRHEQRDVQPKRSLRPVLVAVVDDDGRNPEAKPHKYQGVDPVGREPPEQFHVLKVLRTRPYFLGREDDPKIIRENDRKSRFRPTTSRGADS